MGPLPDHALPKPNLSTPQGFIIKPKSSKKYWSIWVYQRKSLHHRKKYLPYLALSEFLLQVSHIGLGIFTTELSKNNEHYKKASPEFFKISYFFIEPLKSVFCTKTDHEKWWNSCFYKAWYLQLYKYLLILMHTKSSIELFASKKSVYVLLHLF